MNNKTLTLLRNAYDDNHGWIITVEDKNRPSYKFKFRMREYLKAWKRFDQYNSYSNTQAKIEIGNIYKNKSEKEELRELVGDLYWEWDRMSSSGQETLEKIADLLGDREIVEDKYIFGEKANG
tara:strand:- start:79 stop:447 length:369 start_codon:yes stop_codon:yes gene_type:complete